MISKHIPDPDLITSYAERQISVFSYISPWTKLVGLVLVVLVLTLTRNLIVCICLYIAVLSLYTAARLPLRNLFAWYAMPIIFVLSLVGILVWTEPGIPLLSFSLAGIPVTLTNNGLTLGITLTLKALISITISLFFL